MHRDDHLELSPIVRYGARRNSPLMAFDDGAYDVQAETAAGDFAFAFGHRTEVLVEEMGGVLGWEAGAMIANLEMSVVAVAHNGDLDCGVRGRVLDRVAQQVRQ